MSRKRKKIYSQNGHINRKMRNALCSVNNNDN